MRQPPPPPPSLSLAASHTNYALKHPLPWLVGQQPLPHLLPPSLATFQHKEPQCPLTLAPSSTLVVNTSAFSHTAKHLPSSPANDTRALCPTGSGALARVRKSVIRRWKDRKACQEWPQSQRPSEEHACMHARTATLLLPHLIPFFHFTAPIVRARMPRHIPVDFLQVGGVGAVVAPKLATVLIHLRPRIPLTANDVHPDRTALRLSALNFQPSLHIRYSLTHFPKTKKGARSTCLEVAQAKRRQHPSPRPPPACLEGFLEVLLAEASQRFPCLPR